mmetsp:Transcript_85249/g.156319  ORF Transcript_85249/g.156319 Transcript_85249/m.156319 type:complete len:499 (-) Transcript_85249:35-1531(-)
MISQPSGDVDSSCSAPALLAKDPKQAAAALRQLAADARSQPEKVAAAAGSDGALVAGGESGPDSEEEESSSESQSSEEHGPSTLPIKPATPKRESLVEFHGPFMMMKVPPLPPPATLPFGARDTAASEIGAAEKVGILLGYDGSCLRVPYGYGVIRCTAGGEECFFARPYLSDEIMAHHLIAGDRLRFCVQDERLPDAVSAIVTWAYSVRRTLSDGIPVQRHSPAPRYRHRRFSSGVLNPVKVLQAPAPKAQPVKTPSPPRKAMRFEPPPSPAYEAWLATKRKLEEAARESSQASASSSPPERARQECTPSSKRPSLQQDEQESQDKQLEKAAENATGVSEAASKGRAKRASELQEDARAGQLESLGTTSGAPKQSQSSDGKTRKGQGRAGGAKHQVNNSKSAAAAAKASASAGGKVTVGQDAKAVAAIPTLQVVVQTLLKERCDATQWGRALAFFYGTSLAAMLDAELLQLQRVVTEEATVLGCAAPKVHWHGVVLE